MTTQNTEGDVSVQCYEISSSFPSPARRTTFRNSDYPFPTLFQYSERPIRNYYNSNDALYSRSGSCLPPRSNVLEDMQYESKTHKPHQFETSTRQAVTTVISIFALSLLALLYIYVNFPELQENERQYLKIPWDIEDAKLLGQVLDRYKEKFFFEVLLAVFVTYIFLQTFAIPGSISLSILSGFLFPFPLALLLVCFCSATGASLCYVLSYFMGKKIVYKYFPERASKWAAMVNRHRDNIFNYLLFLRVTPFLPNWFINIASPVIGVPLFPFWLGTFIGVAPPSFVAIQAGQTLYNLSASSDSWSWTSVILLTLFAVLSLLPVLLKKQLRDKFE